MENRVIHIRADANYHIGMGHIMRCLSIADAASVYGYEVIFILADEVAQELVKSRGYKVIILHSSYDALDEELKYWPKGDLDLLVVDSYYVTPSYLHALKKHIGVKKLVYIDGRAAFPYPVDIVVNYNIFARYLDYHGLYADADIPEPRFILGTDYAPLRSMFRGIPKRQQPETVKNVLISTGGADSDHLALQVVKAEPERYTYHLLLGALNKDRDEIKRLSEKQRNIAIHENISDMKTLIISMDIAVSAAGSTLYEICACGVPLISYSLADNQILGAEAFEKMSLAVNLGDIRTIGDSPKTILAAIDKLGADYRKRVSMGSQMQELIDGYGAERLVLSILACE